MNDPTSTRRPSSRRTSTPPPTTRRRSASSTTSPTPPLRRAEPTTTVTTAETRPTTTSPTPPFAADPKRTPPKRHGDITELTWTEMFLRAGFLCSPSPLLLAVSSAWQGLCFQGRFWNFPSGDVGLDSSAASSMCVISTAWLYIAVSTQSIVFMTGSSGKEQQGEFRLYSDYYEQRAHQHRCWVERSQLQNWKEQNSKKKKKFHFPGSGSPFLSSLRFNHFQPVMNFESLDNKSSYWE